MTPPGASSSSSSFTNSWTYDVFLSFRGEDTRNTFTDHLHSNLIRKGIKTFIDDGIRRGEEISPAILRAIEESRISIIVFSENYASSKWCLDELLHILRCKESNQQMVYPVFYKVDPSDVRNQKGSFGKALAHHQSRFNDNMEKVQRWRRALTEAANLAGWCLLGGHESKFINNIVEDVSMQVSKRTFLNVAKYPVGIESRVGDMTKLLHVGGKDIRMVGMWGIGGIGKTTIAKAVYNSIAHKFEGSCFLANVRERSTRQEGLVKLQKIILLEILGGKELEVTNVDKGITLIQERLGNKKVLLVIDDVNQLDQLNKLAGGYDWFGLGSRIIITTRDKHLLHAHQVSLIYEVKELGHHEALELFSWNALKRNRHVDDQCVKIAESVVEYARGLPLALIVLGSLLCGRSIDQWESALDSYKRVPNQEIQEILKLSYDALEDPVKELFLDIACFFTGRQRNFVIQMLEGSDINPKYGIEILIDKALINIGEKGFIWMHELLEEMGKEIVPQESPTEPGGRSRLWCYNDIYHVLTENTGTNKIKGIKLNLPEGSEPEELCLNANSFSKMKSLQFFMNRNVCVSGEVDYLPNGLRLLHWHEYPLESFPSNFNSKKLANLYLSGSSILQLRETFKGLQNLRFMFLEHCKSLNETPDFSGIPNLETLFLSHCTSLVELHPSLGFLDKLIDLAVKNCCNLTMFPKIVNMISLQVLNLEGCTSLENFPEIVGKLESLKTLGLSKTAIKELPSASFGYFINLQSLHLTSCENLINLPCSIYELQQLEKLFVRGCSNLVTFPKMVRSKVSWSAETLSLGLQTNSKISQEDPHSLVPAELFQIVSNIPEKESDPKVNLAFPKLIGFTAGNCNLLGSTDFLMAFDCVSTLQNLDLSGVNFIILPVCITKFVNLRMLWLCGCKKLREIPELPQKIKFLSARDCVSLENFSKLSNILDLKDFQMIPQMNLTNCRRLRDNLARTAMKKNMLLNPASLFSHILSSQQSEFAVVFPGSDMPKWFSCRTDLKEVHECIYSINIPHNFKWEKKGLAFCAVLEKTENSCLFKYIVNDKALTIDIYVKEVWADGKGESTNLWLLYQPFLEMMTDIHSLLETNKIGDESSWVKSTYLLTCQVHFVPISKALRSFGVHVVSPQEEEVSINVYSEDLKEFVPYEDASVVDEGLGNHDVCDEDACSCYADYEDILSLATNPQKLKRKACIHFRE